MRREASVNCSNLKKLDEFTNAAEYTFRENFPEPYKVII